MLFTFLTQPRITDWPLKSPGIKTVQSKYGTGTNKKQSFSSQNSVEVPATPTVPLEGQLPSFIDSGDDSSGDDRVFQNVDEEDTPPSLPPPPILPKQPVSPQLDLQPPTLLPIVPPSPKSFKQLPIIQVPEMMSIEEEEVDDENQEGLNKVVEPQPPIPVLPPRESVSKANSGVCGMRGRAESAPAIPPRKPPLVSRRSEGSVSASTAKNDDQPPRPPVLPPRRSKK